MTYPEAIKIVDNLKECYKAVNQKCTMDCSKCSFFEGDADIMGFFEFTSRVLKKDYKVLTRRKEKGNEKTDS